MSTVIVVSQLTKAITVSDSAYYRSDVWEGTKIRHSIYPPEKILDDSCILFGSNLEGRKQAAAKLLKTNTKLPFAVIPSQGVYMIPTASTRNKRCIYVSYFHVASYEAKENKTFIYFADGSGMVADTSVNSFDMQYKKASQLIVHSHRDVIYRKGYIPVNDLLPK
ncbi:competence protein ComK [Virgibacillus sp. W0181]|uniref:competence protein ComK n=1 Tax=Virgibacillus sp. W0181 TaxID=3391581 RepID=UPI003F47394F